MKKQMKNFRLRMPLLDGLTAIAVICVLMLFYLTPAYAAQSYTVENVKVDVTAENALKARDQAFEEAQRKAFESLAKRLAQAGEIPEGELPSDEVISGMIQDFEVTREKVSAVRYIGLYTFRFSESAVKKHYNMYGSSTMAAGYQQGQGAYGRGRYVQGAPQRVLVIPVFKDAEGRFVTNGTANPWSSGLNTYVSQTMQTEAPSPVTLIMPDLYTDTMPVTTDAGGFSYDAEDMRALVAKYSTDKTILAVGSQNNIGTHIDLYSVSLQGGAAEDEPTFIRRITISGLEYANAETDVLWNAAARRMKYVLSGTLDTNGTRYASADAANAQYGQQRGQGQYVQPAQNTYANQRPVSSANGATPVMAEFRSAQEWRETYMALKRARGISHVEIASLTPRSAQINLYHSGSIQNLTAALEQAGLSLQAIKPVSAGGAGAYKIRMTRYAPSYTQRF